MVAVNSPTENYEAPYLEFLWAWEPTWNLITLELIKREDPNLVFFQEIKELASYFSSRNSVLVARMD